MVVASTDQGESPLALADNEFADLMDRCPSVLGTKRIVVGVSGGADSMALTLLADAWARQRGISMVALTVDHGLRDDAAREASRVGIWLRSRGISHRTLRVSETRPVAGIQNAARNWRFAAFNSWCRDNDAGPILLAHTVEDQAETLWLRMLADSGPDGLAAMAAESRVSGLRITRPLLTISKHRLIATCRLRGQDWIEDPSNRDPQFTRVRLRKLAEVLDQQGLGVAQASRIIAGMAGARAAMDRHCAEFMSEHGRILTVGVGWFDGGAFARLPALFSDILISRLVGAIGGGPLPPRQRRVTGVSEALRSTRSLLTRTLGGCVISRRRDGRVWIYREPVACADPVSLAPGAVARWDSRFEVHWRGSRSSVLGPLGDDGWRWIKRNDRETSMARGLRGLPHMARLSIPTIRELDGSVSVPHFVVRDGVRCAASDALLVVGFSPDAKWVGPLITPMNAD
jgi:tRNA(Ile)-lysidine synthase